MYRRFILYRTRKGEKTASTCFQSDDPVAWDVARDRIRAAGLLDGYKAGSWDDGWMLSVDPSTIQLVPAHQWEPLP
jgi:hypothetical protein